MSPSRPTSAARALDLPLSAADPQVAAALGAELHRQRTTLQMIASENVAPRPVLEAQGAVPTDEYAEGSPGRRSLGGCEHADVTAASLQPGFDGAAAARPPARAEAPAPAAPLYPGSNGGL